MLHMLHGMSLPCVRKVLIQTILSFLQARRRKEITQMRLMKKMEMIFLLIDILIILFQRHNALMW
jgi:hypothetical protein